MIDLEDLEAEIAIGVAQAERIEAGAEHDDLLQSGLDLVGNAIIRETTAGGEKQAERFAARIAGLFVRRCQRVDIENQPREWILEDGRIVDELMGGAGAGHLLCRAAWLPAVHCL